MTISLTGVIIKKQKNCEKSNKVCRGTQAKSWVEKVKPDPLNLLVKTIVGSNDYERGIAEHADIAANTAITARADSGRGAHGQRRDGHHPRHDGLVKTQKRKTFLKKGLQFRPGYATILRRVRSALSAVSSAG